VKLIIPEELKNNKEAVGRLEDDAKQLNRVFNSVEDYCKDIIELENVLAEISDSSSAEEIKQLLSQWYDQLVQTQKRFTVNVLWFVVKDLKAEETEEILNGLTSGQKVQYQKCVDHLDIKRDIVKTKFEEIKEGFQRLLIVYEEKKAVLDKLEVEKNQTEQPG
jgi:cytoplasmic iron level regulating protein YaaA (DUF328/UPF0246 family)